MSDGRVMVCGHNAGLNPSQVANAAVVGLERSALAGRFRSWTGRSGRRYMFSVYSARSLRDDLGTGPCYDNAVVIAARCAPGGSRSIARIGITGTLPDLFFKTADLASLDDDGTLEVHVHLLASGSAERLAVVTDLAPTSS